MVIGTNTSSGTYLCELRFDNTSGQNEDEDQEGGFASQPRRVRHSHEETVLVVLVIRAGSPIAPRNSRQSHMAKIISCDN